MEIVNASYFPLTRFLDTAMAEFPPRAVHKAVIGPLNSNAEPAGTKVPFCKSRAPKVSFWVKSPAPLSRICAPEPHWLRTAATSLPLRRPAPLPEVGLSSPLVWANQMAPSGLAAAEKNGGRLFS